MHLMFPRRTSDLLASAGRRMQWNEVRVHSDREARLTLPTRRDFMRHWGSGLGPDGEAPAAMITPAVEPIECLSDTQVFFKF